MSIYKHNVGFNEQLRLQSQKRELESIECKH